LKELEQIAPVYAVRGNIDEHAPGVPDVLTLEVIAGSSMRLRILLTHIAVYGPKLRAEVAKRAVAARAGLVVCGHSHVPFIGRDRGIGMFNPGSIGPRRFALPIVLGCIELTAASVRMRHIDCETGADWLPPARS
jgi:putative phosphoesterase